MNKKQQVFDLQVEGKGTLSELSKSLRSMAFAIDNMSQEEIDEANNNDEPQFSDIYTQAVICPFA